MVGPGPNGGDVNYTHTVTYNVGCKTGHSYKQGPCNQANESYSYYVGAGSNPAKSIHDAVGDKCPQHTSQNCEEPVTNGVAYECEGHMVNGVLKKGTITPPNSTGCQTSMTNPTGNVDCGGNLNKVTSDCG